MFFQIVGTVEQIELVSTSPFPQLQKGLIESWKLCLNLCSLRWLKPSLSRDRSFIPLGLWQLHVLLADGLMNDRILFLKVAILSEFLIFQSNLFHSIIVEGKKSVLEEVVFHIYCWNFITLHCYVHMTYYVWE